MSEGWWFIALLAAWAAGWVAYAAFEYRRVGRQYNAGLKDLAQQFPLPWEDS